MNMKEFIKTPWGYVSIGILLLIIVDDHNYRRVVDIDDYNKKFNASINSNYNYDNKCIIVCEGHRAPIDCDSAINV